MASAGQRGRTLAGRALRKLDRIAGVLQPRALTVALLAPDGGGKTTLATELARRFFLPSRYIYMGTNLRCQHNWPANHPLDPGTLAACFEADSLPARARLALSQ